MKQVNYPSRGQTVYGFAHVPDGDAPSPALLLCHGFTGCAMESSRLFVHFAEQARRQGIYVLRMDFLGSGNSELDFAQYTTPSGWVEDIYNAVTFLRRQPEVDARRLGLLGISLGGFAALMAGVDPRVSTVVAWNPVLYPEQTFRGILSEENWNRLASTDCTIDYSYSGNRFSVCSQFVHDLERMSVQQALRTYADTSVCIMQGTADTVINPEHALRLKQAKLYPIEQRYMQGEDHSFLNNEQKNFDETLRFLKRAFAI